MCDLTEKAPRGTRVKGWKVVIEINGEYFSPATGVKYESGKRIPKPKDRLTEYFRKDLFELKSSCYRPDMRGRTAVFIEEQDARMLMNAMVTLDRDIDPATVHCIPATVSNSVMLGDYGHPLPVAAGKRIWFEEGR